MPAQTRFVDAEFTEGPLETVSAPAESGNYALGELKRSYRVPLPLYLRDLTAEDIIELAEQGARPAKPRQETLRIKESHHAVARLLALGQRAVQISTATGYTPVRIRQLEKDPAMKELIAFYRSQVEATFVDVKDRLALLSVEAVEEMRDRINDPERAEKLSIRELHEIATMTLDRTGHGTVQKSVNVNTTTSDIERLRAEALASRKGRVIVGKS